MVKLGLTEKYIICLPSALKHRFWVLITSIHKLFFSKNKKNITIFHQKVLIFTAVKTKYIAKVCYLLYEGEMVKID